LGLIFDKNVFIFIGYMNQENAHIKVVARNRKAFHDYHILQKYEAGLVLEGSEVKSLRAGLVSLKESYAAVRGEEIYLINLHITPYEKATIRPPDPRRERKLLLTRRELKKIIIRVEERGMALVPLTIYFKDQWAKVEIALAQGKRQYDKRADKEKLRAKREMEREFKERQR
jgi:SsrA-binding protein